MDHARQNAAGAMCLTSATLRRDRSGNVTAQAARQTLAPCGARGGPPARGYLPIMGVLEGKRALVTGGTAGLGLGIAERFGAEGARVVITGRDHDLGERALQTIGQTIGQTLGQTLGPGVRFLAADAADPDAVA